MEVPVIVCDHWTEEQIKAFRIQVNKSAHWAQFDDGLLAKEFLDLKLTGFDLSLTGFNQDEIVSSVFGDATKAKKRKLPGEAIAADGLQFRVVVDCSSEQHQAELLARFKAEGLKSRALIS
jgi:hypothetical protein